MFRRRPPHSRARGRLVASLVGFITLTAGSALSAHAQAVRVPGVFATGLSDAGTLLEPNARDPHWELTASPDATYPGPAAWVVQDGFPIPPWIANSPESRWIGPRPDAAAVAAAGNYTYTTRFSLSDFDPTTAVLTGRWSSDNSGVDILLNGVSQGLANDVGFEGFTPQFEIRSGFVDGLNTLAFIVNNASDSANPTGFRAELALVAESAAVPGTPPTITSQPSDLAVGPGETATFGVGVRGGRPVRYQWRVNGSPVSRATNSTYTVPSMSEAWIGGYSVVVLNDWGSVTSRVASLSLGYRSDATRRLESPGPSSRRTGLTFTEIHYHPVDRPDGRNLEFIELYNSNPFPEDLGSWRISGEWDVTLPPGTVLPARSHLVIAADPAALRELHGITNVIGGPTTQMSKGGGTLRLRKPSGAVVLEVNYDDSAPWPRAADGFGPSLVLARPSLGEGEPGAWRPSTRSGGSPGGHDPEPSPSYDGLLLNEVLSNPGPGKPPFVEVFNSAPFPRDISDCVLQADKKPVGRVFPGTTVPARGWRQIPVPDWNLVLFRTSVILWDPASNCIDSIELPGQTQGNPSGRSPDGAPNWINLTAPTPEAANAPRLRPAVVVNEIHYHPPSDNSADEFVEILNRGTQTVDLSGWQLSRAITFSFPAGTLLAPGQVLAVAADATRLRSGNPQTPATRILGNFFGRLSDGGESLVLSRPGSQVVTTDGRKLTNHFQAPVEVVAYRGGGRWSRWADGGGSSLERVDPRSEPSEPDSWAGSDESSRGAWTLIEATGIADLTHPSVAAADQLQIILLGEGEALVDDVEVIAAGRSVLSNGGFESGLLGWVPQGTHRPSFVTDVGARSGTRALRLVATERGDHVANRIRKPLTQTIATGSSVTLRARVRWLRGHPEILLRLRNGALEASGRLEQPAHVGSPGLANPGSRTNQAPVVSNVRHEPLLPAANQSVRVIARIADPDGVGAAQLLYRRDPDSAVTTVPLRDDGNDGDERAGDGEFTGRIPGQTSGTLIAFRIEARDAAASAQTNLFPAATAAAAAVPECLVRFGEPTGPGSIGTYRLWMTAATIQRWASREIMSNEGLDVTFVHGTNRVIYNAAARYSGSSYTGGIYNSPVGNLCGYDIAIPKDNPFLGGNRVLLDWPIRDDTYLREQLMFWFLERLGLPNMYRRHVHLYVNGQRRGAVYEDIQQPGSDTIQEWFSGDDEGSLWKTDCWNEFDDAGSRLDPCILNTLQIFNSGGQKKVARYRWNWRPRAVRGSANDFSDLFSLVNALNVATQNLPASAEALVDVDQWMRTFAMNDLASFWDAFGNSNGKNTFLYKPERGRWALMSWDFDVGLGVFNDPPDAPLFECNDPVVTRLYQSPPLVRRYWTALDESLNGFFQTGPGTDLNRFLDQRVSALQAAGTSPGSVEAIKSWIAQRRAYLSSQVARHRAAFAIRSNNGNDFTTAEPILNLTGTAPVRVASLRLNGIDWPAQWTTTTNWTLRLALRPGTNRLEVTGVDRFGLPVPGSTDSIQIRATGAEPPIAAIRINEWMASNNSAVQDPADGGFDDWFELFNTGDIPVDLTGYTLTDDLTRPARQTIPFGFILQPRSALLVWADGQPEQTRAGQTLHVNFQLNRGGDDIALFDTLGRRVDAIRYTYQATDVAEGRWGDGADGPFFWFAQPSPGTTNNLPAPGAVRLGFEGILDPTNDDLELRWLAYTNRIYRIEAQSALGPLWEPLEPDIRASSTNASARIRPDPADPTRLFRLRLLP